ncbi:MAG TPA: hypothetical protein VK663_12145 [Burkholderiales bacterium]|nr:hypothetical protein [Burkholderiales bacterium]
MKNLSLPIGFYLAAALLFWPVPQAPAADYANLLTPARPGLPLAHPIAESDVPPPPFSLIADRPKDPAYVAALPGLPQGRTVTDDYGVKRPKFDGVFIRKSRIENGQVVIPPGGLAYLEDTWGGEVALRGEPLPVLGRMPTYVDYDMSIVVKENVTIPAGQSVAVGGQVYHYYATVGHEQMMNHALHVKTIAGTDWAWAFGNPILSSTEAGWWGMKFAQLYNQGQAREVNRERMVFDWISGVRTDRMLLADEKVFSGLAKPGQEWKVGALVIRLVAVDAQAGTAQIQVLEEGIVKLERTLGPVNSERLIEDTAARKALVFEYADIAGFLVPGKSTFQDGQAELKLYGKTSSMRYGDTYARDSRFTAYPVGCPTGHNFGFMLVNKEEIRIAPGAGVDGPEKYFKIFVDKIAGTEVQAWHVEDQKGNRSVNLGGSGVTNIDLVLGQGRVAGQAILADVGRAMAVRSYTALSQATVAPASSSLSAGAIAGITVLVLALAGIGYEFGRRRASRSPVS